MQNKITIEDYKSTLESLKNGSIIFRPTTGNSFIELDHQLVCDAFEELLDKAALVKIGLDESTACDKLLIHLFTAHARYYI